MYCPRKLKLYGSRVLIESRNGIWPYFVRNILYMYILNITGVVCVSLQFKNVFYKIKLVCEYKRVEYVNVLKI